MRTNVSLLAGPSHSVGNRRTTFANVVLASLHQQIWSQGFIPTSDRIRLGPGVPHPTNPTLKVCLPFSQVVRNRKQETKGDLKSLRAFAEVFELIPAVVAVKIFEI